MRRHTIRSTLFATYAIIILISFIAFSAYFVFTETQNLRMQVFSALRQNAQNVSATIDNELTQMNMVAMNVSYSNLVKDTFYKYLEVRQAKDTLSTFENAKMLGELLTSILGPNRPVDQVNLYALDQGVVASGMSSGTRDDRAEDQPWFKPLKNNGFSKTVYYKGQDPYLSRYYTDPDGKRFIAFVRRYYDLFSNPQGYVEIQKSVRKMLASAINYESLYGESILILDQDGNAMLPQKSAWGDIPGTLKEKGQPNDFFELKAGTAGHDAYALYIPSAQSDFTTVLLIDRSDVLVPVTKYLRGIILPLSMTLLFALVLAFVASKRITQPIRAIYHEVRHFDLEKHRDRKEPLTKIMELSALHDSFFDMQAKVESSMQKQLMLQRQEMQSRMLALQSQMNPHFLYNSLAAIQSMAEEGMAEEIVIMCQAMSRILRYISSDTGMSVRLRDELQCTEDFLQCMVIRYQGDLSYDTDIPEKLMDIQVPKLCLQLLVENAVKFVSSNRPPWHIHISGSFTADRYEVTVSDNGPGFDENTLRELNESIRVINETGLLPSLSIGGMGLLNIYARYRMLNSHDVIFVIANNIGGGASVTMGGYYEG
jgi:sensor histidine kinase YesM